MVCVSSPEAFFISLDVTISVVNDSTARSWGTGVSLSLPITPAIVKARSRAVTNSATPTTTSPIASSLNGIFFDRCHNSNLPK